MSTEASQRHRGIIHQRIVKVKTSRLCYSLVREISKIESNKTNLLVNAHTCSYTFTAVYIKRQELLS